MKKEFFVLILCCAIGNGLAAPKKAVSQKEPAPANAAVLDTIRENFSDGTLARIYQVQKGTDIREGVAVTYHPNGKVAVEAPYKNGKLDGVFRSYYENGNPWQTIGYREGIEHGISTDYYENGMKKMREVYKDGVLNGMSEQYSERGLVWRAIPYVDGHIHGVAKVYDELGALKEEMTFQYGMRNGPYRRYNKGIKVLEAVFEKNRCVKNCDF